MNIEELNGLIEQANENAEPNDDRIVEDDELTIAQKMARLFMEAPQ